MCIKSVYTFINGRSSVICAYGLIRHSVHKQVEFRKINTIQGAPKVLTLLDIYVLAKEGKDFWDTLYMNIHF
jgi:hypothetical protein